MMRCLKIQLPVLLMILLAHAAPGLAKAAEGGQSAEIRWLEGTPELTAGATWGVPWPQGLYQPGQGFALTNAAGEAIPMQTWPLATWPDGSVKWTAHAIGPNAGLEDSLRLAPSEATAPAQTLAVEDAADAITVNTGVITARIPKSGNALIESIEHEGKQVLEGGRLVVLRRDEAMIGEQGTQRQERFESKIDSTEVEHAGPLRVVVKIEGMHRGTQNEREWLPFTVRLYFYAGGESVRVMHTFIFDGDENKDFISGMGVRFDVPMTDEPWDRHVRFSGEDGGLWAEAVKGVTGLRRDPGRDVRQAQIDGKKLPPIDKWDPRVGQWTHYIPSWGDFTLSQLSPDGFELRKRTEPGHAWIRSTAGHRAPGLGYVGGASGGGVVFGLRDFWQRYPSQLDIRGATSDKAEVTMWLYSPEAQPLDMRFYHDGMGMETHQQELDGLNVTYEDYEKGWGTPLGVARTTEMTLWAVGQTPERKTLTAMSAAMQAPPQPVAAPEDILEAKVFGALWSLPDRSTPLKAKLEDRLDYMFDFYKDQVDQRRWYGFWDYGDVMHAYDTDRHEWRYDVGGYAWDNSELSPDLWLWYSFLRTGRADQFRMAEAMTRHTGEVDVHHIGPYAGFGSRHNVMHWGDSSKQPRVSTAAYRRFFYYLTADERTGDLMRELVESAQTFKKVYVTRKVDRPNDPKLEYPAIVSFGTDYAGLSAAWLTEWERTGDTQWRDALVRTMQGIAAQGTGWFAGNAGFDPDKKEFVQITENMIEVSHLNAVFGAMEINAELLQLLDVPEYEKAWVMYCQLYNASREEQQEVLGQTFRGGSLGRAHARLTAYAGWKKNDPRIKQRAWNELLGGRFGLDQNTTLLRVEPPAWIRPVDEAPGISTNDAAQDGLAIMQCLALAGDAMPESN